VKAEGPDERSDFGKEEVEGESLKPKAESRSEPKPKDDGKSFGVGDTIEFDL
jgi:hypothetical protein